MCKLARSSRAIALIAAALMAGWAAEGPVQPLPFSHKSHAGTSKAPCKMCHPNPDPGWTMTIAPASVCMQCHSAIRKDSPAIQKLASYARDGKAVPWAPVYGIPEYVEFSHRAHIAARSACEDCHGKVAEREVLYREVELNMAMCMDCHAGKRASVACDFCHEPR